MDKSVLRSQAKILRDDLTEHEIQEISEGIMHNLRLVSEFNNRSVIHVFYPIKGKKEIDLSPLIEDLWQNAKTVVMPRVNEQSLSHYIVESTNDLEQTKWGMMEPKTHLRKVASSLPDIIIVPLLTADREKNRLGYGAGFYDRFLSETSSALKIGVMGDRFLTTKIPVESHDVKLDLLITEKRVII